MEGFVADWLQEMKTLKTAAEKFDFLLHPMFMVGIYIEARLDTRCPRTKILFQDFANLVNLLLVDFPKEMEASLIERFVCLTKVMQDNLSQFCVQNNKSAYLDPLLKLCSRLYSSLDILIMKCMLIYPHTVHPSLIKKADKLRWDSEKELFHRIRLIFFYYVFLGPMGKIPQVYLNLKQHEEVMEVMFLHHVREETYARFQKPRCHKCHDGIGKESKKDYVVLAYCWHMLCEPCAEKQCVTG